MAEEIYSFEKEEQLRLRAMELATKLEDVGSYNIISIADDIYQYIKNGEKDNSSEEDN